MDIRQIASDSLNSPNRLQAIAFTGPHRPNHRIQIDIFGLEAFPSKLFRKNIGKLNSSLHTIWNAGVIHA